MRCVRARPSLATRWRRAHRGRSSEGCSCPYLFRWRSLREEWSCGAWWCSFPDKPPAHSENRWGRERGRSIPFWDVSNPPILIQTMGGKQLMVVAPKDGYLYGFDLANNSLLYRVPVTQIENVAETFAPGEAVHFCPGAVGGQEWNSPAYDPQTNLVLTGEVDWCDTATPKDVSELRS